MTHPGPAQQLAIASAYKNNCGFHSIAHRWMELSDPKRAELFNDLPIFRQIMDRFYAYYQLDEPHNFDDFMNIVKRFNHPYDRELLLGPVLRETLREDFGLSPEQRAELANGRSVPDDLLGRLANAMGANFSIIITSRPDVPLNYEIADPSWSIKLAYEGKIADDGKFVDDGHFSVFLENTDIDAHNRLMVVAERLNQGLSVQSSIDNLFRGQTIVGEPEQKAYIRGVVQRRANRTPRPASLSSDNSEQWESVVTVHNKPFKPALAKSPTTGPSLTATPRPTTVTPTDTTGTKATPNAPAQTHPPADPKQVRSAFMKRLKKVFPKNDWTYQENPKEINLDHKTEANRNIKIVELPEGMQFTASPGKVDDIANAAIAYHQALQENNEDVEFEINVSSEQEGINFLRQLKSGGLDLTAISAISFAGKQLKGDDATNWVRQHAAPSAPRPSP